MIVRGLQCNAFYSCSNSISFLLKEFVFLDRLYFHYLFLNETSYFNYCLFRSLSF